MNRTQNLREISRQLLKAGLTLQADECSEAADEIDRLTSERNELREQVKAARAVIALVRASRLEAEKARPA